MTESPFPDTRLPSRRLHPLLVTAVLALLWLVPGLIGHDPWKPDEAYFIGLIEHIYSTGDWIVPRILGEPFLQHPPLFTLTAAVFGRLFGWLLPLHDAARLASGFYLIIAFLALHAAAQELWRGEHAWLAVLALIGAIGLSPSALTMLADLAQLSGFALALYGFALTRDRSLAAGFWIGTGAGIAFLSKGMFGPAALALCALLLAAVGSQYRNRRYLASCLSAIVAVAPWLLIWPLLLYGHAPELFHDWLLNGSGLERVSGSLLEMPVKLGYYLAVLPWFAFPALPLAAWAVWCGGRTWRQRPELLIPLMMLAATLLVLALGTSRREMFALPLLLPLAVLAPPGALDLRRGAANALWWFSALFGSFALMMMWFEYSALEIGFPAARHRHWLRLQPGYVSSIDWSVIALAAAVTSIWPWLLVRSHRLPARGLIAWWGGVCLVWAVALVMFLDYVDTGKSYRGVATRMAQHMPNAIGCVASRDLGQPQRILLHYFTGIRTVRFAGLSAPPRCRALIVQGSRSSMYQPGPGWTLLWEGARPGDRKELLRLYRHR